AAQAKAQLALGVAELFLEIALPDHAVVIVSANPIPAGVTQEAVIDHRAAAMSEFVALPILSASSQTHGTLARRGPGMARAQRLSNTGAIELVGNQPGDAALGAEHRGPGNAATAAAAMLVACR